MGFKQLTATQLPLFWRVHSRRRLPWCVRKHTKSVQMVPVRRPAKKCPHGRRQDRCRDCGAPARSGKKCPHGRQRNHCADCGGAGVCLHGRVRTHCRDCGGASYCEHSRLRSYCRDCGGASYCSHGRRRNHCSDCGGGSVCRHQRLRDHCAERNNFLCEVEVCPRQGHRFSSAQSLLGHMRSMHGDNPRAVTKSKELGRRPARPLCEPGRRRLK